MASWRWISWKVDTVEHTVNCSSSVLKENDRKTTFPYDLSGSIYIKSSKQSQTSVKCHAVGTNSVNQASPNSKHSDRIKSTLVAHDHHQMPLQPQVSSLPSLHYEINQPPTSPNPHQPTYRASCQCSPAVTSISSSQFATNARPRQPPPRGFRVIASWGELAEQLRCRSGPFLDRPNTVLPIISGGKSGLS